MSPEQQQAFFSAALSAGAILTGFCGTFLSFRIQREANYHRQPALDFQSGKARDVVIGLSHFTTGFLMIGLATLVAMLFGFVVPLLALAGITSFPLTVPIVSAGLIAGLVLMIGYFIVELAHYRIISNRLVHDAAEWGQQSILAVAFIIVAGVAATAVYIAVGWALITRP